MASEKATAAAAAAVAPPLPKCAKASSGSLSSASISSNTNTNTNKKASSQWQWLRDEFTVENFSLNFNTNAQFICKDPERVLDYFHSTQWPCCNRVVYLAYRIGIAIYYTIWFVESIFRNIEFREKNYKIFNRKTSNSLLLHPWPLYMTSWSLTVLFVHLWLSAFIVLYFYSIEQKPKLAAFFTYIFGAFSCSRQSRMRDSSPPLQAHYQLGGRTSGTTQAAQAAKIYLAVDPRREQQQDLLDSKLLLSQAIDVASTSSAAAVAANLHNATAVTIIDDEEPSSGSANSHPLGGGVTMRHTATYCTNKEHCHLPSSSVACNVELWQMWMETHVPCVILCAIKVSWLLYNVVVVSAILVTTGYFSYVLLNNVSVEPSWITEIGNLHRHGVNSVVVIVDLVLMAYPVRLLHFVYSALYGWTYASVSFAYWYQNPTRNVVYEQIDYGQPAKVLSLLFFLTFLTFILQFLHLIAFKFKLFLIEKYSNVNRTCVNMLTTK